MTCDVCFEQKNSEEKNWRVGARKFRYGVLGGITAFLCWESGISTVGLNTKQIQWKGEERPKQLYQK